MTRRLGLQGRMTVSYVLATVAIVVFVEVVAGAIVLPRIATGQDATVRALDSAGTIAKTLGRDVTAGGALPAGALNLADFPQFTKPTLGRSEPVALVLDTAGRILSTNNPSAYPPGADAALLLPPEAVAQLHNRPGPPSGKGGAAAVAVVPEGKTVWALVPIRAEVTPSAAAVDTELNPKLGTVTGTVGYAYVQAPAVKGYVLAHRLSSAAVVLLLTVPVGVLFGLATTRSLRRRLRRLAEASQAVASGDFTTRLTPCSQDEIGQLERNFNDMSSRLGDATQRERELASQNARLAERSRISRELHDSISQDLFSLALLSGGLQRAVPPDSALQPQIARISETVATAIHEMRALVLDLHPSALTDKGLNAAIEDLCTSLRARLSLNATATLEDLALDPPAQHAILRITQEALANASRHADAETIVVALRSVPDGAELTITDNGRGFDPDAVDTTSGVGLRLMRERVGELGGSLTIASSAGGGTAVRAVFAAAAIGAEAPAPPASA